MSLPAQNRARYDLLGALITCGLVVLFVGILLARDPLLFWNDDYELSILPVFADVARSWSEGHWPLLSPYSWVCGNLAGEFQYGTFSLFINAAVVAIWKFPLSFANQAAALSSVHLVVLALGGYLLGRGRNLSAWLAVMIGLVAALNGWMICWGATDWFGALGAFAWFPWAWWGLERAADERRGPTRFLWPVPFVHLLITGGFPYTVVMLGVLAIWIWLRTLARTRSFAATLPLVFGVSLGAAIAAPAWLALLDYVRGSAREAQESAAHFQWIVPPAALPAFLLPAWTVKWTDFSSRLVPHTATEFACGMVAPVVLIFGLARRRLALVRQLRWELGLLVFVLLVSMMPTANVFRWSFRWLPFVHLILVVCAAEILVSEKDMRSRFGLAAIVLVLICGAAMWLTDTAGLFGGRLFVSLLAIACLWAALEFRFGSRSWLAPVVTIASLLATYWCIPPNCGVPRYRLDQQLTQAEPLDPQRLYLSIYPPPEIAYRADAKAEPVGQLVRPGSTSMWGGVRLLNGYSPVRPAGVARAFEVAIHGELPMWKAEELLESEAAANGGLARLGVDGVIVANEWWWLKPEPADDWIIAHESSEARVYHRRGDPLPRVQSLSADDAGHALATASIRVIEDSRQRVVADVSVPAGDRPARLSFSRPYFRGYDATLNGHSLGVSSWREFNPEVELPAGSAGRLVLIYRPRCVTLGGAIVVATLVGIGAYLAWLRRRAPVYSKSRVT